MSTQTEQLVIEQLQHYKRICARIRILEKYPVGNGYYLSTMVQDDQLQELHRKLRQMPSYMYLNKRELQLESTAHAYLTQYPLGTRSQLAEVSRLHAVDREDERSLRELQRKIQKVLEARIGAAEGYEGIIARISEIQDLEQQKEQIDWSLEVLEGYRPQYSRLLRLRYVEDKDPREIMDIMGISSTTFYAWRQKALSEYAAITGMRAAERKV